MKLEADKLRRARPSVINSDSGGSLVRNLKCFQMSGTFVQEILDEFNERRKEFGIHDDNDIISVDVLPPTSGIKIATPTGTKDPTLEVVIVYWE